jgi:hypothetical protein
MSQHITKVVPHDHANCHTALHMDNGDCGTRFEARCSCGWAQGASTREAADAIAVGHRGYSPDAKVIIARFPKDDDITDADDITDKQLRDLFMRVCECRPLDLTRAEGDHAAIHDCDTDILHDIQIALGIILFDDIGRVQAMREARARCAEIISAIQRGA